MKCLPWPLDNTWLYQPKTFLWYLVKQEINKKYNCGVQIMIELCYQFVRLDNTEFGLVFLKEFDKEAIKYILLFKHFDNKSQFYWNG